MKRNKVLLLTFVLMLSFVLCACNAETQTTKETVGTVPVTLTEEDVVLREWSDGTAMIDKYTGEAKDIIIPEKIGDLTITDIHVSAFLGKDIESVVLPDTLKTIGQNAFAYNKLQNIRIPHTVDYIGDNAFFHNYLCDVVYPRSLKSLGKNAFAENRFLDTVSIPSEIENVNADFFPAAGGIAIVKENSPTHKYVCENTEYYIQLLGKTVKFKGNGGVFPKWGSSDIEAEIKYGIDLFEKFLPERTGYIFSGWENEGGENIGVRVLEVLDDMTLTATWRAE